MVKRRLAIGIDLGGSRLKAGLVGADGQLIRKAIVRSPIPSGYDATIVGLAKSVQALAAKSDSKIAGVGLGVAGLMDSGRRTVLQAPNCAAVVGHAVAIDLAEQIGLPVAMDNDATLMAVGEGFIGAARGTRHFIAITLGTGVGGAVVSDGRIIRGHSGGGGELGHVPISLNGPRCGCGARGCLEAYVGMTGVERFLKVRHPKLSGIGLKEINRRARRGDGDAAEVFAYIGRNLGVALAGYVNLFNPEMIVVGGGVAAAGNLLLEPLRKELKCRAFAVYLKNLKVVTAQLGDWAGVIGAGRMAMSSEQ